MKLEEVFKQRMEKLALGGQKVLVAYSTGVDSTVLLTLLQNLPAEIRPLVNVAYIDHQIREQSKIETAYVKQYCAQRDLPLFMKTWYKKDHPQTGIEAAGREVRYNFFKETMAKNDIRYLMTAHHGDDQAETFLMKTIRGGDIAQLVGIHHRRKFGERGELIRPLLGIPKAELRAFAANRDLKYFEDYTNHDDDVLRNRMRHNVIPLLKKENSQLLEHIQSYQDQLSDLLEAAESVAKTKLKQMSFNDGRLVLAYWQQESPAWQRILLKRVCLSKGILAGEDQIRQMQELLNNKNSVQGRVQLTDTVALVKGYTSFGLAEEKNNSALAERRFVLRPNQWIDISPFEQIGLFESSQYHAQPQDDILVIAPPEKSLYIRHRKQGDKLVTSQGRQKVKKIMIDKKVPLDQRDKIWLVSDDEGTVYWVVGLKKSDLSHHLVNAKIHYVIAHRTK